MRTDDPDQTADAPRADVRLAEVRDRRENLHAALLAVERAIARPATGDPDDWAKRVHESLVELGAEFERHIAATESPGGMFETVNAAAPRLAGRVNHLVEEHQRIRQAVASALDAVRPQAHPFGVADASGGRDIALDLVSQLLRHRQAGADLIYEAFETDIGVGD